MKTYKMEKDENMEFEIPQEEKHDLGDYPDGFIPELYDL